MNKRYAAIVCIGLFFLSGCGKEELPKLPSDEEIWEKEAIFLQTTDKIRETDSVTITGDKGEGTRYKKYSSSDLGFGFDILSKQKDMLFGTENQSYIIISRTGNKVNLERVNEKEDELPTIEIFQKESDSYVQTFIQKKFLKGKDKQCKVQLLETFQNSTDKRIYRKRNIIYQNIDRLPYCENEFCVDSMFCGPYAEGETNAYFLSTEDESTVVFVKKSMEKIRGTQRMQREDTIQIY